MIPVRELRNNTAQVLRRVQAGDDLTITVNGVPVASLVPVSGKREFTTRAELLRMLRNRQADPGFREQLAELAGETTDDLGPIR